MGGATGAADLDRDIGPVGADNGAGGPSRAIELGTGLDGDRVAGCQHGKLPDGQPVLDAHDPRPSSLVCTGDVLALRRARREEAAAAVQDRPTRAGAAVGPSPVTPLALHRLSTTRATGSTSAQHAVSGDGGVTCAS